VIDRQGTTDPGNEPNGDGAFGWPAAVTTMFVVLCLLVCVGGARGWLPWQ
jgi:hypothetical protein